jgi:cytochrome c peroxidase
VFTFQKRTGDGSPGEIIRTTDPGTGIRDGKFSNINRFKTPNLRGLASRESYFHGGTAQTLQDVVRHYETQLGFNFTAAEEADLLAFMKAL